MKCRPGDLAVVIGHKYPHTKHCIGRIVKVIELATKNGRMFWIVAPSVLNDGKKYCLAHDDFLHPIRPPGKDRVSEVNNEINQNTKAKL